MIKTVLFDFDGTLVDTYKLYVESFSRTLQNFFHKRLSLKEIAKLRPRAELEFFLNIVGEEKFPEYIELFYKYYEDLHTEFFEGVYSGCKSVIDEIKNLGIQTGIITGKSRKAYEITLSNTDLGVFPVSLTNSEVEKLKPDPTGLLTASRQLNISPEECIYIGDSPVDFEAALNAGMMFGGVLWSKNDLEKKFFLSKIKPSAKVILFNKPEDILNWIYSVS